MSYNVYEGADLTTAIGATTFEQLAADVGQMLANLQGTNPPARAMAVASQIGKAQPTLVGLQEVTEWRTCPATQDFSSCTAAPTVLYDLLNLVKNALQSQGSSYNEVGRVTANDLVAPTVIGGVPTLVFYTQRSAILARADIDPSELQVSNVQSSQFENYLPLTILGQDFSVHRAWIAADVKFHDTSFRFIDTHLESFHPGINYLQGQELLDGPVAGTTLPVVIAMDSNSPANLPSDPFAITYANFLGNGFEDSWTEANPGAAGLTCCQLGTLLNPTSLVTTRVDLILLRGDLRANAAALFGGNTADRTGGVWPSDHVGVAARLGSDDE
ncbi:MAG TPA: hypothetical protein VFM21_02435 [Terriglobia bacterium]|nr:hypothetical protein [Terriglobia bacterium]